jgi:hypothetical protein
LGDYNSYYNLYFSLINLLGGGNPKISKDGQIKLKKEKKKGVVSQKKRGSKKEIKKGGTKKKKKEKKKPKRQETLLFWPQMSATGAEARAAVYKVNLNNRGGSWGSRLERKYQQLGWKKKRAAG